jgi:serine/threonine protein kinase
MNELLARAERGDVNAMLDLGDIHESGNIVANAVSSQTTTRPTVAVDAQVPDRAMVHVLDDGQIVWHALMKQELENNVVNFCVIQVLRANERSKYFFFKRFWRAGQESAGSTYFTPCRSLVVAKQTFEVRFLDMTANVWLAIWSGTAFRPVDALFALVDDDNDDDDDDDDGDEQVCSPPSNKARKVATSQADASRWYERAAMGGNAPAMCCIGHRYQIGLGVSKSAERAMEWFRRAAAVMDVKSVDSAGSTICHNTVLQNSQCRVGIVAMFCAVGGDVNAVNKSGCTVLHCAADDRHRNIVEMLIAAGADVNRVDQNGRTACHIAAMNGQSTIVELMIAAGVNVEIIDADGHTAFQDAANNGHVKNVELLIGAGANICFADLEGRTACHDAIENSHESVIELLIAAGADIRAVDARGRSARSYARNPRVCELLEAPLTRNDTITMFDSARTALATARAARNRLASLDVIPILLADAASPMSTFSLISSIGKIEFVSAERAFAQQQDALRAADQLEPQMITMRDEARRVLVQIAATVVDLHDAAPLNFLHDACGRVAAADAALVGWRGSESDETDCEFDAWLSNAHKAAAFASSRTERSSEALAAVLGAFGAGADETQGRQVAAALARVIITSGAETKSFKQLRIPHTVLADVVARLDELRTQVACILDVVERARDVRAVTEAPSGARFEAAQKNVAKFERHVRHALVELDHPDDVDDLEATKEELRVAKAALMEARSESIAAVVELAAHAFDFPELRLRFPKARLDDLVVAGGDVSSLRTLDQYENRVKIAETRNTVERASFDGVACALKLFRLVPANQRAFVKEARRLRQLAHPNIVEVRAVFVDPKNSVGVIEMPLYTHGDLWQWLAATRTCTIHDKLRVLRAALCGLEHVHRMGIVHADVKPENVFVDAAGVAKLGDFDVSKDAATRVTLGATIVGFSLAYAAPEVLRGVSASKAGDVYAFGLTMFDIVIGKKAISERPVNVDSLGRHEPIENGSAMRRLTRHLLDAAPERRISASDALKSTLFAPPAPGRDAARDRRECSVCCDTRWLDEGLSCDRRHFVCNGDLELLMKHFCQLPLSEVARRGALRCNEGGCAASPWSNADLARALPERNSRRISRSCALCLRVVCLSSSSSGIKPTWRRKSVDCAAKWRARTKWQSIVVTSSNSCSACDARVVRRCFSISKAASRSNAATVTRVFARGVCATVDPMRIVMCSVARTTRHSHATCMAR